VHQRARGAEVGLREALHQGQQFGDDALAAGQGGEAGEQLVEPVHVVRAVAGGREGLQVGEEVGDGSGHGSGEASVGRPERSDSRLVGRPAAT